MAKVKGLFTITGSIKNISFYTRKGSDQVYARSKGGPSKEAIRKAPQFEALRKHQKEWGACSTMAAGIRQAMQGVLHLSDFNTSPALSSFSSRLISLDTEHPKGERSILLSQHKEMLTSFALNRKTTFEAVLKSTPTFRIDRNAGTAEITLSQLNANTQLHNSLHLPYFRLTGVLGAVSDMICSVEEPHYWKVNGWPSGISATGNWHRTQGVIPEQTFQIRLPEQIVPQLTENTSLILSIGIEFGAESKDGTPEVVKSIGAAKIFAVV
jgi:hypothetical protein